MRSVNVTFRPIDEWPGKKTQFRRSAPFRTGYAKTMDDLDLELFKLSARNVVIQLALTERDIRNDGMPRSDARPMHPGVILSFDSKHGPLRYPCDTFDDWQDNLRAIALALEALRKVDRYGVTKRAEQYRGWKQLPGAIVTPEQMTPEDAARLIASVVAESANGAGSVARNIMGSPDTFNGCWREAVKRLHPDGNGGREHPDWNRLMQAGEILNAHHKL